MLPEGTVRRLGDHLAVLYGPHTAAATLEELREVTARALAHPPTGPRQHPPPGQDGEHGRFSETDAFVIAYGDHITTGDAAPLQTLRGFLTRVAPEVTGLHLLPHYPSTSDGGFAVADHDAVDPRLGSWADVHDLAADYRLMLDAVVNHTSAAHRWFHGFLEGDPRFAEFYLTADPRADAATLADVTRPRTSPLLTRFGSAVGPRWVWTTFSADQVDLDFTNPQVLLAITEVLLRYVAHGASWLRLDAIAFLWKELGTSCMHLPQTHEVVRLWRTLVDAVAPGTVLLTETNVPHQDNISYLAGGQEAHAVYQFALPPLTLAAFHQRSASALTAWLANLRPAPEGTTFLNFLASHDGIGLRPAEGLLDPDDVRALAETVTANGGLVSWRTTPEGRRAPYELNSTYFDALRPPDAPADEDEDVNRFLAAHALLLMVPGVPALYLHSLLGSGNWHHGPERTGHARDINREKLDLDALQHDLADPHSRRSRVLRELRAMLAVRTSQPAFHPAAPMSVLPTPPGQVGLWRAPRPGAASGAVVCLVDVSGRCSRVDVPVPARRPRRLRELLGSGEAPRLRAGSIEVPLPAYGVRWFALD